ncbi:MAG: hypothetical protein WC055_12685, partial [Melioribacteraceae bacterium]
KYRNASLDITIHGFGGNITNALIDNKKVDIVRLQKNISGKHTIEIFLDNKIVGGTINIVENRFAPLTPVVYYNENQLSWKKVDNAEYYKIFQNGLKIADTKNEEFKITSKNQVDEYSVIAVDKDGYESFMSEPVMSINNNIIEVEASSSSFETSVEGYNGKGFVRTTTTSNTDIIFEKGIDHDGYYWIDFKYSNGNGPINTFNACGIRTLYINNELISTIVLPQRGDNVWNNWGYSNSVKYYFKKGITQFNLKYLPVNSNMNKEINEALIDHLRIIPIN